MALSEYKLWIARLIRRRRHHLYGDVLYSLKSIGLAIDSGGSNTSVPSSPELLKVVTRWSKNV